MVNFDEISFSDLHELALLPITKKYIEEESARKDYDAVISIRRNLFDRYILLSKMSPEELHSHDLAEAVHLGYEIKKTAMDKSLVLSDHDKGVMNLRVQPGDHKFFENKDYLLNAVFEALVCTTRGNEYYQYVVENLKGGYSGILSYSDFLTMMIEGYTKAKNYYDH